MLRARSALLAVACVSLCAAAASAPAAPAAPRTVLVNFCGGATSRPSTFVVACGDGNYQLRGLHWRTWGARIATATGWAHINDCVPYCAAGRFHSYPVRLRASRRADCSNGRAYRRLQIIFTQTRPAGIWTRLRLKCP